MRQDADTFDDLRRAVLHQAVISRNVWLAFSSVNDQRFNFISAALQFNAGGKTCATQPGDAELMNTRNQLFPVAGAVIGPAVSLNPAVFAIGVYDNAQLSQCRRMRGGVRGNGNHGT